ncbi:MAG: hypothetical protein MSG64_17870 [Pyrinomonadaceae bacterium MAG19_C2-C3]|nr:hypothetical protein [Pyrinomonadaceae bacterium MAG19_C2-C3]
MKLTFVSLCLSIMVVLWIVPASGARAEQQAEQSAQSLPVREEINQTFQFARFARVDVSGLAGGPVNIETIDGNTVEVRLLRSAQTQAELDCYRTIVENTPDSLTIRHEQDGRSSVCRSIRAAQSLLLRVPRAVDITLKTIGGAVNVEGIDGALRLTGIAGHVTAVQVREAEMDGLAKGLTMSITQPSERGIRVSGIVGTVELNLAQNLNADLTVSNLISIDDKTPGVTVTKVNAASGRTRFGLGGDPISIVGVVGSVRINHPTK